ncbi:MAG: geranylgeranylglyceryl/heptaprenylglyceryl phosphate synthase [Bacteroidota bacterium]|nr:geranylgeranylglyceryl/heptaprenylglyceryl phosphate synthase [Bacteroidota bacterium]
MVGQVYKQIAGRVEEGKKSFALLIDPDKYTASSLEHTIGIAVQSGVSFIFVGGSLLAGSSVSETIKVIKSFSDLPVFIFPGSTLQFSQEADALLFLSLISGRNADLLIGRHVEIAPYLKASSVEVIPTGYMLVDCGRQTTASYISNTQPLPSDKPDIAVCTAVAGEFLGLRLIYMDGGSGAAMPIPPQMISAVKDNISIPLIVGGGIRTKKALQDACNAGADVIVVGNAIESDPELLLHFADAIHWPA